MAKKVLLVDDEEDIVDLLRYNLEREGIQVVTANNGTEALKVAKAERPDLVVLESNHDVSMLDAGSYPFYFKQRIKSDFGHLSNKTAGDLALALVEKGTRQLVLAHLSQENNYPLLAYETTARILTAAGVVVDGDVTLCVAKRSSVSEW